MKKISIYNIILIVLMAGFLTFSIINYLFLKSNLNDMDKKLNNLQANNSKLSTTVEENSAVNQGFDSRLHDLSEQIDQLNSNNLNQVTPVNTEKNTVNKQDDWYINNKKLDQTDEFLNVLSDIYHVPQGTAGCSLKTATAAAYFLNWTESNTMSDDEIATVAKYYFSCINSYSDSDIYQPMLTANFNDVWAYSEDIVNKVNLYDTLESCGHPQEYDSYSMDKYVRCRDIIKQYIPKVPNARTQF